MAEVDITIKPSLDADATLQMQKKLNDAIKQLQEADNKKAQADSLKNLKQVNAELVKLQKAADATRQSIEQIQESYTHVTPKDGTDAAQLEQLDNEYLELTDRLKELNAMGGVMEVPTNQQGIVELHSTADAIDEIKTRLLEIDAIKNTLNVTDDQYTFFDPTKLTDAYDAVLSDITETEGRIENAQADLANMSSTISNRHKELKNEYLTNNFPYDVDASPNNGYSYAAGVGVEIPVDMSDYPEMQKQRDIILKIGKELDEAGQKAKESLGSYYDEWLKYLEIMSGGGTDAQHAYFSQLNDMYENAQQKFGVNDLKAEYKKQQDVLKSMVEPLKEDYASQFDVTQTVEYQNTIENLRTLEEELQKLQAEKAQMESTGNAFASLDENTDYQQAVQDLQELNNQERIYYEAKLKIQQLEQEKADQQRIQEALKRQKEEAQEAQRIAKAKQQQADAEQRLAQAQQRATQAAQQADLRAQRQDLTALNGEFMAVSMMITKIGSLIPGVSTSGITAVLGITRAIIRLSKLTKTASSTVADTASGVANAASASTQTVENVTGAVENATETTNEVAGVATGLGATVEGVANSASATVTAGATTAGASVAAGSATAASGVSAAGAIINQVLTTLEAHPIILLITAIVAAVAALVAVCKKLYDKVKEELQQVLALLKKVGKQLIDLAKNGLKQLLKGVVDLNKYLVTLTNNTLQALYNGIKNILSKIKSLQSTVSEYLDILAQWNDGVNSVNTALSNLTSSLSYVKGALTTAFVPILTTIEPLLTRLMDDLAQLLTYIGLFIARITGQNSFIKAVRVQKDYADSISGVGDAAEEAEQKLASYDKLDVIDSDNDSGSGSGSFGDQFGIDFEEEELGVPDWSTIFREAYNLGSEIAKNLKDTLDSIDWDNVTETVTNAATAIALFCNGLIDVDGVGKSVGKTLGMIVNEIVTFADTIFTGIHWSKLGSQVGDALYTALFTVDWEKFTKLAFDAGDAIQDFVDGLMKTDGLGEQVGIALASVGNAFVTFWNQVLTIDWGQVGTQIGTAIQTSIETFNWGGLGSLISGEINSIATLIYNTVQQIDGTILGTKMSELLQNALDIDWETVTNAVVTTIDKLVDTANAFITPENFSKIGASLGNLINVLFSGIAELATADWAQYGESIASAIMSFFETVDWESAGQAVSNLAIGLLDMIISAIDNIEWEEVSEDLVTFLSNIDWESIGNKAVEIAKKLRKGLKQVWDALKESGVVDDVLQMIVQIFDAKAILEKFFKSIKTQVIVSYFLDKIQGFFEKVRTALSKFKLSNLIFGEPTEEDTGAESIGRAIVDGIVKGLFLPLSAPLEVAGDIFDWITGGIKAIFGIHSPAKETEPIGENIILGILDGFSLVDFAGKISEWWDTNVAPWFTLERWQEVAQGMLDGLGTKVEELKTNLGEKFEGIKTDVGTKVDELKTNAETKWETLKENVTTTAGTLKENAVGKFQEMRENIKEKLEAITSESDDETNTNATNLTDTFEELKKTTKQKFEDIKNNIVGAWEEVSKNVKAPINSFLSMIEGMVNRVIDGVNGMVDKLNTISWDVPSWVPKIGGSKFGITLNHLDHVSLPRLAQGAVIPPNREFAAVLGDQKSGVNIETPLETMVQAFKQALSENNNNQPIVLQLNGRTVARAVWDEEEKRYKQTGRYSTT